MIYLIGMIVVSYLIGSIPTSIIAGKLLRGKEYDIRKDAKGSGNAGATNVFRLLGWKTGVVVLLIDMLKGLIPTVWFAKLGAQTGLGWETVNFQILAGLSAVFGHIWTIFAGFKGGKGVGTGAGMVIGLAPLAVLICLGVFVATVALSRFVSLGSILASLTLPVVLFVQRFAMGGNVPVQLLIFSLFIPALILYTHRSNLKRLLRGTENKIQLRKS
ncbi:MAG: glycerol-3-phosphate 1-O-acyltransferase PlsY [Calditrichaceae bacterium]|nr:glycerol-3-phosphate 1-O-acyltransferase PlsY [Calditrichia bacterium]NUQ40973.1 glycerol-3-phosphate 1-O-acyltransferase PlsY [Calditrichaceae bacterium]